MNTSRTHRRTLAVAAAVAAVVAACGGDADADMTDAACDRYADLQAAFFGDPAQLVPAAKAFADAAPDAISAEAEAIVAALGSDDPEAMGSPDFVSASERVGDAVFAGCDTAAAVDVDGIDYAFDGLPASIEAGRVALRLHNSSETRQPHELIIVTGTDGQTADELRDLPMQELMQQARPIGLAFVDAPGASATTLVDLAPGSYLVLCTLPVAEGGQMPDDDGPHDTHADHGMVATVTVV